tara:strand:+ start:203 stop:475 length:273 start_codon:yes stop_codon:yes gene_type:complete
MNICVVSTFEGSVEDYMSMMAEVEEEMKLVVSEFHVGVVDTGQPGISKIITIANVIDMDRLQELMTSPKMLEWDKAHNNTDVMYSLELMS